MVEAIGRLANYDRQKPAAIPLNVQETYLKRQSSEFCQLFAIARKPLGFLVRALTRRQNVFDTNRCNPFANALVNLPLL